MHVFDVNSALSSRPEISKGTRLAVLSDCLRADTRRRLVEAMVRLAIAARKDLMACGFSGTEASEQAIFLVAESFRSVTPPCALPPIE